MQITGKPFIFSFPIFPHFFLKKKFFDQKKENKKKYPYQYPAYFIFVSLFLTAYSGSEIKNGINVRRYIFLKIKMEILGDLRGIVFFCRENFLKKIQPKMAQIWHKKYKNKEKQGICIINRIISIISNQFCFLKKIFGNIFLILRFFFSNFIYFIYSINLFHLLEIFLF